MPHLMSGSPLPNKKALNLPSALRRSLVATALAGLLLSAPPSVLAQTPPIDTRATVAVSQADFPEADSVLMLDDIRFDVKPDRTHIFDEHDVVKALTSDGVEENASLDRILDESQTRIEVLRARTIKADGTVVNSPPPQLTPLAPNSPIYSSIKRFSLRFPDLEVGDMVEFHLRTIHKPKPGGHFWATTYVENPMPILDSSFVVTVPKGVSFQTATPNLEDGKPLEETVHIEGTDYRRLSWAVSNKNAFQFQALSPPPLSLLGRIEISSFQNWDEVADYVGQRWKANSSISEGLALRIAGWLPTPSDTELRAKSVLKEIGRHRRAASFLSEEPVFHRPSQTFPEELISMADSSLLTSVALSSAGVPNIPVAVLGVSVSSLQNQLPHPEKIERIILEVPISGRDSYWVDPEAPGFLLSSPPPGASGTAAISWDQRFGDKKGGPQNLAVAPALQSREELAVEGRLERNGRAELTLQFDRYGNAALNARQAAREIQEGTRGVRERTLDSFFSSAAQAYGNRARLLSRFFESNPDAKDPFSLALTVAVPGFGRTENDTMTVPLPRFLSSNLRAATMERRRTIPLRFEQPYQQDVRIHLIFPEGSAVTEAPSKVEKSTPEAEFVATGRAEGNQVWYVGRLTVKEPWVEPPALERALEVLSTAIESENTEIKVRLSGEPSVDGQPGGDDEG